MLLRSLLLAGAIALRTHAFLVVPNLEGDAAPNTNEGELMGILPLSSNTPYSQQVELLCDECPFNEVEEEQGRVRLNYAKTSLSLNFSVEDTILFVNDRQLLNRQTFPPPPSPITAVQRRVEDDAESGLVSLGYALEVIPMAPSTDESGLELLSVRFTVLEVDGRPVPLDTVAIALIHDRKGKFYIAKTSIEETAPDRASWKQCRGRPTCMGRLLAERIRTLFASAKSRVLGMASKMPGRKGCDRWSTSMPRPDGRPLSPWALGRGGHMRPGHGGRPHYHMHHMHHMHNRWERTASQIVRFVIIPATLGVLAGLVASALGMLVGQIIVSLWMRYRRSNSRQENPHLEQGTESEKQNLMIVLEDDLPPAYTDDSSGEPMLEKN